MYSETLALDEAVVLVAREVLDVLGVAGDEVVHADDLVAFLEQAVGEVGTEEARAAGDDGGGHFVGGGHG